MTQAAFKAAVCECLTCAETSEMPFVSAAQYLGELQQRPECTADDISRIRRLVVHELACHDLTRAERERAEEATKDHPAEE